MFAEGYKVAGSFTKPVILATRFFDETIECSCGAYVVLNDEGWIMTVSHFWNSFIAFQQHIEEIEEYKQRIEAIQADQRLDAKRKRKKISRLPINPKWIINNSFWWGKDDVQLKDIKTIPGANLVIGRLEPFAADEIEIYPVLKDPASLNIGTSLCKLGYPIHQVNAAFNEEDNTLQLAPGAIPPLFPIDGIYTATIVAGKSKDEKYDIKFIETSTPGLRGQSGGPVFDAKGTVWALQSTTVHIPSGYTPRSIKNGREVEENQFLNLGIGIHPELIVAFLKDNEIKFNLSDY